MKKILIAQEINIVLQQRPSFLNRKDNQIFTAASNDEALRIQRDERVDLIITQLDMPGMSSEQLCTEIRREAGPRPVPVIMVCANTRAAIEQASRCRPDAVMLRPINPPLLLGKAESFLDISSRRAHRVHLSVAVGSNARNSTERGAADTTFFCRSEDISASGMQVESAQVLAQGDEVECSISLADETRIQVNGAIVRSIRQTHGTAVNLYGVRFTNLSAEGKKALEAFIDTMAHRSRV